jgi:hypothetical protein
MTFLRNFQAGIFETGIFVITKFDLETHESQPFYQKMAKSNGLLCRFFVVPLHLLSALCQPTTVVPATAKRSASIKRIKLFNMLPQGCPERGKNKNAGSSQLPLLKWLRTSAGRVGGKRQSNQVRQSNKEWRK